MFSLKSASLLDFTQRSQTEDGNLQAIYGIKRICSDTQLREVLDKVEACKVRGLFAHLFQYIHSTDLWKRYRYWQQYVIVSVDGVEHFSSQQIHCAQCLTKEHTNGQLTYSHSMLAAVAVHPHHPEVIPLDGEPIVQQDGKVKNDCERNAAKRLLKSLKERFPRLKALLVADALYANGPFLQELQATGYHFVIGVKPDSHKALLQQAQARWKHQANQPFTIREGKLSHHFQFANNLPLCASQSDRRVNLLSYQQVDDQGKTLSWNWITDLTISKANAYQLMKAGRSRWKIENETFNTLKNQGYRFEHNYGHGQGHLATTLAYLMMLAFTVDQLQQAACQLFRTLWLALKTKAKLWESLRAVVKIIPCHNMSSAFKQIALLYQVQLE